MELGMLYAFVAMAIATLTCIGVAFAGILTIEGSKYHGQYLAVIALLSPAAVYCTYIAATWY